MDIGPVGPGKMGGNMAHAAAREGHTVVGYDRNRTWPTPTASRRWSSSFLPKWVGDGAGRRADLRHHHRARRALGDGDLVVDGGKSSGPTTSRTPRRWRRGASRIDCGVPAPVWGLQKRLRADVRGLTEDVAKVQPAFDALKPTERDYLRRTGPRRRPLRQDGPQTGISTRSWAQARRGLGRWRVDLVDKRHRRVRLWRPAP